MVRKKINVLHVTYDMRIGGTEQVIKNLIESLDTDQYQVSIFCIESPLGPWGKALQDKGVDITVANRSPGFDRQLIGKIRKAIKQQQIDIIHCHQYTPYVYGLFASIGTKAKIIFTEHGRFYPDSSSLKRTLINPLLALLTDKITAISAATKQALIEFENLPEKKIQVIYNGIEDLSDTVSTQAVTDLKSHYQLGDEHIIFGTIARLDPIKNQIMMLRAFAKATQNTHKAKLFIIGDGEMREALEAEASNLDIKDKVIFTGYIAKPHIFLQMLDIYLLSSLSEGTSMTLLEAMSFAKPCLVTDAGGNAEIITHEQVGKVTPNDDVQSYALAIQEAIENPQKNAIYGANARKRYQQHFHIDKIIQQYDNLYQSLINTNKA